MWSYHLPNQDQNKTVWLHECVGLTARVQCPFVGTADSWHSESQSWQLTSKPSCHSLSATPQKKKSVYKCAPFVWASHYYCLTILLFTSSSMALTSSAALGVSELLGRAERRDADWKRGRKEKKESYRQRNETWTVKRAGAACIHVHWLLLCMWSGSPLLSLDPDIPHVHIRTGLCVISLIKGLIGGQGEANHRLVSGSMLSGGFRSGVRPGTGLLFKQEHRDWSKTYIKQTLLLNTAREKKCASATETRSEVKI